MLFEPQVRGQFAQPLVHQRNQVGKGVQEEVGVSQFVGGDGRTVFGRQAVEDQDRLDAALDDLAVTADPLVAGHAGRFRCIGLSGAADQFDLVYQAQRRGGGAEIQAQPRQRYPHLGHERLTDDNVVYSGAPAAMTDRAAIRIGRPAARQPHAHRPVATEALDQAGSVRFAVGLTPAVDHPLMQHLAANGAARAEARVKARLMVRLIGMWEEMVQADGLAAGSAAEASRMPRPVERRDRIVDNGLLAASAHRHRGLEVGATVGPWERPSR